MTQLDEQLSALRAQLAEEILARQRAEASSRESDERFHLMFEQAGTGIAQLAPDGAWLRVNQRLCDMLGYTREEFVQLTIHDITDPEYLQTCLDLHRRALAGEIESYSFKKYYRCKDGSPLWASVTGSLVRD